MAPASRLHVWLLLLEANPTYPPQPSSHPASPVPPAYSLHSSGFFSLQSIWNLAASPRTSLKYCFVWLCNSWIVYLLMCVWLSSPLDCRLLEGGRCLFHGSVDHPASQPEHTQTYHRLPSQGEPTGFLLATVYLVYNRWSVSVSSQNWFSFRHI